MKQSENFKFKLPEAATDNVNIEDLNDNFKAIDKRLGNTEETISGGFTTVSNSNEWVDLFIMEAEDKKEFEISFRTEISNRTPDGYDILLSGKEVHPAAYAWWWSRVKADNITGSSANNPGYRRLGSNSNAKIVYQVKKSLATAGANIKVTLTKHAGDGITYTIPTAEQSTAATGYKIAYITSENDIQTREDVADAIIKADGESTLIFKGETTDGETQAELLAASTQPGTAKSEFINAAGRFQVPEGYIANARIYAVAAPYSNGKINANKVVAFCYDTFCARVNSMGGITASTTELTKQTWNADETATVSLTITRNNAFTNMFYAVGAAGVTMKWQLAIKLTNILKV